MRLLGPLHVAWRLVFRSEHRLSSHLKGTVLGISLSLVPLVLVLVVSTGLIQGITTRFLELGTFHLQLRSYTDALAQKPSGSSDGPDSRDIPDLIRETETGLGTLPGVRGAFRQIEGLGMLYSPDGRAGISLKGIDPGRWQEDRGFREFMILEEGSFDLNSPESAVITRGVANKLKVHPGDTVTLLTSRTSSTGSLFLRPSFFTVVGICSTGYYELDALTLYIVYERGDSILREQGTRYIGLKLAEPYGRLAPLQRQLEELLGNDWYTLSWQELQRPMYASFETSRNLILLIMALIVLVATLNISATLGMLVLENQEQIAILKATGTSPGQIRLLFVAAGLLTGAAGVIPGLAAGLLLAVNINGIIRVLENGFNWAALLAQRLNPGLFVSGVPELFDSSFYLDTIPVELDPLSLWLIASLALAAAAAAALLPASRAARLRPLEILQKR